MAPAPRSSNWARWIWDPDPEDDQCVVDYAFLTRRGTENAGGSRASHQGLFAQATWLRILASAGYRVEMIGRPAGEGETDQVFLCRRSDPFQGVRVNAGGQGSAASLELDALERRSLLRAAREAIAARLTNQEASLPPLKAAWPRRAGLLSSFGGRRTEACADAWVTWRRMRRCW